MHWQPQYIWLIRMGNPNTYGPYVWATPVHVIHMYGQSQYAWSICICNPNTCGPYVLGFGRTVGPRGWGPVSGPPNPLPNSAVLCKPYFSTLNPRANPLFSTQNPLLASTYNGYVGDCVKNAIVILAPLGRYPAEGRSAGQERPGQTTRTAPGMPQEPRTLLRSQEQNVVIPCFSIFL